MATVPALWMAVYDGRVRDVVQLASVGVDLDESAGHYDYSPLHVAVEEGRAQVVEILLDHGACVSIWDIDGKSPLCLACCARQLVGRVAMIKSLLEHGADVNNEDYVGQRPLNHAIRYASIQSIKLLLKHGANISLRDDEGYNALHCAVRCHREEMAVEHYRVEANHRLTYALRPTRPRRTEKAVQVIQTLLTHTPDVYELIAALYDNKMVGETPEEFAYEDEVVEILRSALLRAHEKRRILLEAFTT